MPKSIYFFLITICLFQRAFPASTLKFNVKTKLYNHKPVVEVTADQFVILRIRNKPLPMATQIAQRVAHTLQELADTGTPPTAVHLTKLANRYFIKANNKIILQADKRTHPHLLELWLKNIQTALNLPRIVIEPSTIIIPLQEEHILPVKDTAKGNITISNFNPQIVDAFVEQESIKIKAKALGKTQMVVSRAKFSLPVTIFIKKYAGKITSPVTAEVTGIRTPQKLIEKALYQALEKAVILEKDAIWQPSPNIVIPESLDRAAACSIHVPVKITGDDYITAHGTVTVNVKNQPLKPAEATKLLISNQPEKIKEGRMLLEALVKTPEPTRILFHHQNGIAQPLNLIVDLLNLSSVNSRIQVVEGNAKPGYNPVLVGHRATKEFMQNYLYGRGYICEVPPIDNCQLVNLHLSIGQVASGILQLRLLTDAELKLRIYATYPKEFQSIITTEPPRHTHTMTTKKIQASHEVGGKWSFISIGGEYGTIYDIALQLINNTDQPETIELVCEPTGGVAAGVFIINNQIVATRALAYEEEGRLVKLTILPHQSRQIELKTMPQAGSNYPVRIIVRPLRKS